MIVTSNQNKCECLFMRITYSDEHKKGCQINKLTNDMELTV